MAHTKDCWIPKLETCSSPHYLVIDESLTVPVGSHWWSGWPGAYCVKCGSDEPNELCLADGCQCPCHPVLGEELEEVENDVE